MRAFVLIVAMMAGAAVPADAASPGETYDCHFPKAGHVVIDTREPGASVRWQGAAYPVIGGSDFYRTDDAKILILFGPRMKWWNFGDGNDRAVCPHRANLR